MAEFAQSPDAWSRAWLDMQKQYLDAWQQFSPDRLSWQAAVSPFTAARGNPWANAFDQWSKLFGQGMPQTARDVNERLFELGKSYLSMSESFWKLMQQGKDASAWTREWQQTLQDNFKQLCQGHSLQAGGNDPWSGFASLWGLPLGNWQRMACAFSPFPGEMEKALREEQIPEASEMTRAVRHFLSVPPVGYTREWQEQLQDWTRFSVEYLHAMQDFGALLGKVVQRALELFGTRVTEKTKAGESFDGLRALYNLWIDCGEEAYAEQVATPEFPKLQAELVNALMRMKRHEQMIVEEVMTAFNIPTRREMDTSHRRVHELQQQVRQLQDALEDATDTLARPQAEPAKTAATQTVDRKKPASTAKSRARTKTRKG